MLDTEYWFLLPDILHRMLVENILADALDFPRIKTIEPGIEIQRNDGRIVGDEHSLGLTEEVRALGQVRFQIRFVDECVIARVFPAGAVVAAGAQEQIEERIRIVVIANPTGSRDVIIQFRLRAVENLSLDLPQLDLNAENVVPHLLQLDGDLAVQLRSTARRREKCVLNARKTFAPGKTRFGQKFAGLV